MEKRIYIDYYERESGGEPNAQHGQWTTYEPKYINVDFIALYKKTETMNKFFYHSVVVDDDTLFECNGLYLAVIRYSTGNTFGRTNGCWEAIGVAKTEKEADALNQQALDSPGHKPWDGYFQRLEGPETYFLPLK